MVHEAVAIECQQESFGVRTVTFEWFRHSPFKLIAFKQFHKLFHFGVCAKTSSIAVGVVTSYRWQQQFWSYKCVMVRWRSIFVIVLAGPPRSRGLFFSFSKIETHSEKAPVETLSALLALDVGQEIPLVGAIANPVGRGAWTLVLGIP